MQGSLLGERRNAYIMDFHSLQSEGLIERKTSGLSVLLRQSQVVWWLHEKKRDWAGEGKRCQGGDEHLREAHSAGAAADSNVFSNL